MDAGTGGRLPATVWRLATRGLAAMVISMLTLTAGWLVVAVAMRLRDGAGSPSGLAGAVAGLAVLIFWFAFVPVLALLGTRLRVPGVVGGLVGGIIAGEVALDWYDEVARRLNPSLGPLDSGTAESIGLGIVLPFLYLGLPAGVIGLVVATLRDRRRAPTPYVRWSPPP